MIELPDFNKSFEYENNFFLSCNTQRISKLIAHHQLFLKTLNLTGHIVECGVFKGASLVRWAHFREMYGGSFTKKIIGFDVFGEFPKTNFDADKKTLDKFVHNAGSQSISLKQLEDTLTKKGLNQEIELVKGDINASVPEYVEAHPELKISLLNLDTDIYEPAVVILEHLYPKIVSGGIILLDDYGVFPGETQAVDEYFENKTDVIIKKLPYSKTPSFIIKK
ncbi:TylF/MycF/NovP-related O-methyltransferase [Flammeovirgaceae bacterium SG7u.111]|nr:TylF/MycF/NovP-related O-methyltransferase [Flammeovirgaceae bacterium SG7u.132]WPO34966.1 TylF/MycF/NovP-related O-methyltransferase [Flammeovirgaceae bacterium SG7u.111]